MTSPDSPTPPDENHHRCFHCGAYTDECMCSGGHLEQAPTTPLAQGVASYQPNGLLPCPFCGGEATTSIGCKDVDESWIYIECIECAAMADPEIWNSRTRPPVGAEGEIPYEMYLVAAEAWFAFEREEGKQDFPEQLKAALKATLATLQLSEHRTCATCNAVLAPGPQPAACYENIPSAEQAREEEREFCAQIAENYRRDASFNDSMIGAGEHNANQSNIASAIRQRKGS